LTIATAQYDSDGSLTNGPDAEPGAISSVINSSPGLEILDFTVTDNGGDNLPTKLFSLTLTKGTSDNTANWKNLIAGAVIDNPNLPVPIYGSISENTINFTIDNLAQIENGSSQTYKVKIWLKKDLSAITDNSIIQAELLSQNILTDTSGSALADATLSYPDIILDITASRLTLTGYPLVVKPNIEFPLTVKATDINGNTDSDFSGDITLSTVNVAVV
jgi:hypothetical protein